MEIHVLASGSDGNCYVIRSGEHTVMLDQGMTYKHLVEQMNVNGIMPEEIECILVTHEHSDHVKGVGVICVHRLDGKLLVHCLKVRFLERSLER